MSFIMPGFWYTLRVLIHQVFTVQSLKAGCGFDCSEEKLGLMYSSFIYIAALRKQVEAYTDCVQFSCTMHLQHNYISPTSVILALLCDIFYSTQREVHWWEYSGDLFEAVQNTHSTCFTTTLEAVVSRHPWESEKVSMSGAGCLQEYKNSEFVLELRKKGFSEGSCK